MVLILSKGISDGLITCINNCLYTVIQIILRVLLSVSTRTRAKVKFYGICLTLEFVNLLTGIRMQYLCMGILNKYCSQSLIQ